MNILLISNMYPSKKHPDFGVFVERIVNELKASDNNIDLCVRDSKGKNKLSKVISYLSLYLKTVYKLIFNKYDYIYCHYVSHTALPILIASFFGKKMNIVSHVHGGDIKLLKGRSKFFHRLKNQLTNSIFKKSSTIICPSPSYSQFLLANFNANDKSIIIYPSGGVDRCFNYDGTVIKSKDEIVIGYAGRLVQSKNVDLIIKALKGTKKLKLSIVGEGEQKSELMAISKDLNVEFINPLPHAELASWFKKIDLLIYPSESESLGLVPLEAMACGVYCILTKIPAFNEFKSHGLNFLQIDDFESDAIRDAIVKFSLFGDDELNIINKKNSEIVIQKYGADNVKEVLKSVFQ
ncbi:TPA: glycosyltransferase family 4 protein [Enterobacter hormaechei subsp. xiangfangensis]|uniref:glycosyltransferase family 4 protein n=1 Tax=Enterobacter hormaechei TaxID=158836 RepID=UPI0012549E97|nr:glycosyltransferase family 4 protein [Enterobacter hormaechei]MCM7293702.1 glycosyltransferase family 4 protein [Enterobacter hormaechei]VAF13843.1 group 1 glycosyl transferase [Enterobacter hormaechei]